MKKLVEDLKGYTSKMEEDMKKHLTKLDECRKKMEEKLSKMEEEESKKAEEEAKKAEEDDDEDEDEGKDKGKKKAEESAEVTAVEEVVIPKVETPVVNERDSWTLSKWKKEAPADLYKMALEQQEKFAELVKKANEEFLKNKKTI
jgi:hypothetical protein